ncbi:MAG: type II toxin-antitoxin system YafQ family toxin [Bacillota bacterium]
MNYEILSTGRFKKDLKVIMKRGYNIQLLQDVVSLLAAGIPLPEKNKDHMLTGDWTGHRECHITPDWLLIYRIDNDFLVLTLIRTGTHSDLF